MARLEYSEAQRRDQSAGGGVSREGFAFKQPQRGCKGVKIKSVSVEVECADAQFAPNSWASAEAGCNIGLCNPKTLGRKSNQKKALNDEFSNQVETSGKTGNSGVGNMS